MSYAGGPPRLVATAIGVGLAAAGLGLLLLPSGVIGSGDVQLSLSGLARPAGWAVTWSLAATLLAGAALRHRPAAGIFAVGGIAMALAVVRFPVALLGLLLLSAVVLPRLAAAGSSAAWSRVLVVGALAGVAAVAAGFVGRQQGDGVVATALLVGFLAAAGALPFGLHVTRWMALAAPEIAALTGSAFFAGVLAALVASEGALAASHAGPRTGLVLGVFGGATAIAAALHAMGARDWRTLAVRTTLCEVGLALVGISAFDIRGLQGAALTLALLAVTRPALLFADALAPRRGAGLALTAVILVAAAGLPPTLGFPARLLIMSAAARVGPVVGLLAVSGIVLEVTAIAVVLRRRLAQPPTEPGPASPGALAVLTASTALAILGGGLFPGVLLGSVFQLGG